MIAPLNLLSFDAKTKVSNSEATGGSGGVAYVSGSLTSGVQTVDIVGTIIENSFASAILICRKVFSNNFAASATSGELTTLTLLQNEL